jgi:hypothetical protein
MGIGWFVRVMSARCMLVWFESGLGRSMSSDDFPERKRDWKNFLRYSGKGIKG